jgi:tungstate transport system substrate-binding protein
MCRLGRHVAILGCLAIGACGSRHGELRLATTTSVDNSGLLIAILPAFELDTGIAVRVLAVGSGRALQLLRRGDADVAITHDPAAETALLNDTPGVRYRKIMFNDFLIVGPPDDPAGVGDATTTADAMRRVAASATAFASRGDESGTQARTDALWNAAGRKPSGAQLLETGQGMAPTLRIASERRAYALTDRATFLQLGPTLALQSVFEGGSDLLNTYAATAVSGRERDAIASRLITWMAEGDGRAHIAAFASSPGSVPPFTVWPANRPASSPDALPQ